MRPSLTPHVVLVLLLSLAGGMRAQEGATSRPADPAPRSAATQDETRSESASRRRIADAVQDLGESVIIASGTERRLFDTPDSVWRIDEQAIAVDHVPSTFPDTLRRVPGVMIQKTGPGLGSPFIRGLTGFQTLFLIDGVRLNNSIWRSGPNQYSATLDPLGLGSIEVLKGPSSVLYGSDAAGGTVYARTAPVDLAEEGTTDFGGRVYYRFNTAEASHVARLEGTVASDGVFGARVGVTGGFFGDTDAGGDTGRMELSYDQTAADAKIYWVASRDVEIEFLFQHIYLNNVPRAHSTVDGSPFHGAGIGSDLRRDFDQERDLALLTFHLDESNVFDRATIKVGWQHNDEIEDRVRSNGRRDLAGFDVETLIVTTQFEHDETAIGDLVWGVDVYGDFVDSFGRRINTDGTMVEQPQGPVADDSTYFTVGFFVQDTIRFDWGELILGARYEHVEVDANEVYDPMEDRIRSLSAYYDTFAGSAKLLVHATDELNVYVSASSGYRAPNLSDLTRFDSARSNEFEVPSPDLDPEYFLGLEAGAKYLGEDVQAEIAYFYTFLFDSIQRRPTGVVVDGDQFEVVKENVGDGYVHGIEAAASWEFVDDLTASGQITLLDGSVDNYPTSADVIERGPISRDMPATARVALTWHPERWKFYVRGEIEMVAGADRLSPADMGDTQRIPPGGTPGYTLYNLSFGYEVNEDLDVFLHLLNLGDKEYRIHGSGSQEAGFSAVMGFDLRF